MSEAVYTERKLYVVANADGDITADVDRQTAIDQMCGDYGGDIYRVFELKIKLPRPRDYLASIILREEDCDAVTIETT